MKNLSRVVPCAILLLSALPGTADAFETGNAVFTQSSTSCGFFSGNGSFGSSLLLGSYTSNNVTYYYLTTTFSGANIPTTNVVFTFNTSNNTYTVNIPPSSSRLLKSSFGSSRLVIE